MFSFLFGELKEINKDYYCLDVNGVGYKIYSSHYKKLKINQKYLFYIRDLLKDNELFLYGFLEKNELMLFNKLIEVTGVGSKTAINLLSHFSVEQIVYFIKTKNKDGLSSVPGIGNKSNHIIFELSNKLKDFDSIVDFEYQNVYQALISIGYNSYAISENIAKIPKGLEEDEALKLVIRGIKDGN